MIAAMAMGPDDNDIWMVETEESGQNKLLLHRHRWNEESFIGIFQCLLSTG